MTVGRRKLLIWIGMVMTTVSSGCAKVAVESTDEVGRFLGPFVRLLSDILNGGSSQSETTSATPRQSKETATGISIDEEDLSGDQNTPEHTTAFDEFETPSAALFEINDTIELSGGEFAFWSINLEQYVNEYDLNPTVDYSLIVRRGSAVDMILMRADEFTHFKQGERYRYNENATTYNTTSASKDAIIGWHDYRLVIENTSVEEVEVKINAVVR